MKILRDRHGHFNGMRITDVAIVRDDDGAGYGSFGNTRNHEAIGADDDGAFEFPELYFRAQKFLRTQASAANAHFASGEGTLWGNGLNMRSAIDVFSAEDTVGKSHSRKTPSAAKRGAGLGASGFAALPILIDLSGVAVASLRVRRFLPRCHRARSRFLREASPVGAPAGA